MNVQYKWKIYDTTNLVSAIPNEITPMQVIEPPAGYKVTNNTKIKYLELYPEFITYVDEFIGELDDTDHFKHEGTYLINYFRENGYDDGITQFYEERFEIRVYFSLVLILIFNCFFFLFV